MNRELEKQKTKGKRRFRPMGLCSLVLCLFLLGCKAGVYRDPNDPAGAGVLAPEVLRRNLKAVSDMLNERLAKHEIDRAQYQVLIERAANEFLDKVSIDRVDPEEAWLYVEVLRTAERWDATVKFARVAVKHAEQTQNSDRLVNDTLRLAQALAHTGKVDEAIATARTVFTVAPNASAPILPATLYEIVPAARAQGHDPEVAKLLEDAIDCHMRTVVDPNSDPGRAFLGARLTHVRRAWQVIIELYEAVGDKPAVQGAAQRAEKMLSEFARA